MKRLATGLLAAGLLAGVAAGQDLPGFSVGGFYETRIDNRVNDENLAFDYYGGRFQFRDERWFTVYADVGSQTAEWGDYESDPYGFFGFGGTLWLARAEDLAVPLDIGLAGGFHRGNLDIDPPSGGAAYSATYSFWTAQGVIRASGYGAVSPFIRAGVGKSKLDVDGLPTDDDWEVLNPAVNVGVEISPADQFVITLEGNYSEGVGFAVHADLWF